MGILGAALVTAGCGDPVAPTTPTPAVPTVTDSFSDTLLVLRREHAPVHRQRRRRRQDHVSPAWTLAPTVGLGIGTQSLGACTLIDHVEAVAGQAVKMSGTATVPGTYCVEIYDLGNLVEPAVYTINVLHS